MYYTYNLTYFRTNFGFPWESHKFHWIWTVAPGAKDSLGPEGVDFVTRGASHHAWQKHLCSYRSYRVKQSKSDFFWRCFEFEDPMTQCTVSLFHLSFSVCRVSNPKHTMAATFWCRSWKFTLLPMVPGLHSQDIPRRWDILEPFLEPEKSCRWIQLTIWLFNIAMENPQNKWRYLAGKIIYFYGPSISHGYVSHNQRVDDPTVRKGQILPGICAKSKVLHKQKTANPWLFEWKKWWETRGLGWIRVPNLWTNIDKPFCA